MLYKRMPFIKRQVKHLTKEALDPTRCFSIVLDQVRTISFRQGWNIRFLGELSSVEHVSVETISFRLGWNKKNLGVLSPAEHVSVETISFCLDETKGFSEYSHPQSTSLENFLADKAEEPYIRPWMSQQWNTGPLVSSGFEVDQSQG